MKLKSIIGYCCLLCLVSCGKYPEEFDYSFAIAKSWYVDSTMLDSTTFYYDNLDRLLRVDQCNVSWYCDEVQVVYTDNSVEWQNQTYLLDEESRIIQWIWGQQLVDYLYDGGLLTHEKTTTYGFITNEHFYTYDDGNLEQDSGINYPEPGKAYPAVYHYTYTDTLAPRFLVGFSGLFEFPPKHRYLVRESVSPEHGILYRYTYEIADNQLFEYKRFCDLFHDTCQETWITKYYYLE